MNTPDPELDTLLRKWGLARAASPERLADLRHRIVASAEEQRRVAGEPETRQSVLGDRTLGAEQHGRPGKRDELENEAERGGIAGRVVQDVEDLAARRRHPGKRYGLVGLLAAACAAAWLLWAGGGGREGILDSGAGVPHNDALTDDHLEERAELFRGTSELFDQRLGWLAESGEKVDLGVRDRPPPAQSPTVALRLIVERRRGVQREWSRCCAVDILSRSEEVVRFRPDCGSELDLTVWPFVLPDGMLVVDTVLSGPNHAAPLSASRLHQDRSPVELFRTLQDEWEVRVVQFAVVL